jgi:hypothetical protein
MKLEKYRIEAIRAATLRLEEAQWPGYDISVAVGATTTEEGEVRVIVTRSRRSH